MKMEMKNRMRNSRLGTRHIGRRGLSVLLALTMTLELVGFALPAQAASLNGEKQNGGVTVATPPEVETNDVPDKTDDSEYSTASPSDADSENEEDETEYTEYNTASSSDAASKKGIKLMSDSVEPNVTQKTYLAAHAGTYVTEKEYEKDGITYEGSEWSIVIADDGSDITLQYNGEDTGAAVTKLTGSSSITAITFGKEGEWYTEKGEGQNLSFSFNSAGYITMPEATVYGEDNNVLYRFSNTVYMYNQTKALAYFEEHPEYQGTYTLPDGSGWNVTIGESEIKLTGGETGNDIFLDYVTFGTSASGSAGNTYNDVKTLVFSSADWYNISNNTAQNYHRLTLTWTTTVSSSYAHKSFKCSAATLYDSDKKPIKGFTTNCYFIANDGIFSYNYFKEGKTGDVSYVGDYVLSEAYGAVYGNDIDGIGEWKIQIDEDGHVYLQEGEKKYEAVMTTGAKENSQERVNEMYVALPGWYTNKDCYTPAYVKLIWGIDSSGYKSSNYGKGALYFDVCGSTAKKGLEVYKPGEGGATGNSAISANIPAMRFELSANGESKIAKFAKSKLAPYAISEDGNTQYRINDGTGEYIEITEDGSVVLHIGEDKKLTPLYYTVNNAEWLAEDPESSRMPPEVTSVVFSSPDWYAQKDLKTSDRPTLTLNWNAANRQFAVASEIACCQEDGTLSRLYTTAIKYQQQAIDEGLAYMYQYVKGTYTLNDGSKWTIEVKQESEEAPWKVYTKFGTSDYVAVDNPAPEFVQDPTYTGENGKGEYGNKGKYLSTITVPVEGWYLDEACTQNAVVTLTWKGNVVNPMDYHQFTVTGTALYRENGEKTECKYLVGTFYSDADKELGEEFIKSLDIAGTYRPTAAEGKWYIEIGASGKVTVHATDSQNVEHIYEDIAMNLTMDKNKPSSGANKNKNPNFGKINGVKDIKVVIPEWRTVGTNNTLANIAQCAETTFTFVSADNGASYFSPEASALLYADTKEGGEPWEVVTKSGRDGYNKDLVTKIYTEDRAYSDANRERAKEYFKDYPGTYYIEDASVDYKLTVTEEGEIYWGDYAPDKGLLPADVAFDAIHDANGDGKVNEDEHDPVPGTISVWLNGYSTGTYTASNKDTKTTDGIQRADFIWNDTDKDIENSAHKFKTSKSVKGYKGGGNAVTFAADKYYTLGEEASAEDFVPDGTYKTANGEFRIEVVTKGEETTYTFYRPDTEDQGINYPLKIFGSGDAAYLRGKIGKMKKNDVYILVTKGPYEGFLLTGFEVEYNDLNDHQETSSSAPTVLIPAGTRFTNYALDYTVEDGKIRLVNPGDDDEGTRYDRLSIALHSAKDGATIYLEDDIKVGFMAILPDNVGTVTIVGQGHKITRDSVINPNTILTDPEIGENDPIMNILMNPGISLMALNDESEESAAEHYTGAILQIGAHDKVTLKDVTVDGEGKWEIDQEKLEYDKQLNKDYDINVLDDPQGGHPIKELPGNVVSTDSLIKVIGGSDGSWGNVSKDKYTTLTLDNVTLENFFAGDGYDDDRHFIDFTSSEFSEMTVNNSTFRHNASRSGVCIGNTDEDEIHLNAGTVMEDNYCYGGNGGLVVAMEGTQVYMEDGTKIINNVAADTNGTFVQLHKRDDGVKDGDNKGEIFSKLHMNGGDISGNVGLRGGSYGWGQTIYLYNGGAFEMNGGEIHDNIGAGISSIYQQPSADALKLNAGKIYNNTCSLRDEGTDWALDIALMNIGDVGKEGDDPENPAMIVEQNFVVGAAAILGGYASGDEYLTNNGLIKGNISVYSYFNNEGNVTTVENNNIIDGNIRLENGSCVKNNAGAVITGNVTVRSSLTESAGESSFHNEGRIMGNVTLAEGAHLYNNGEIFGNVTVKAGATLEMDSLDKDSTENEKLGGTIHGNVTLYPDSVIYADVSGTYVDGSIYLEYEDEEDLARMQGVIEAKGIQCSSIIPRQHRHSATYDVTETVTDSSYKCTEPWTKNYACQTCGKVVKTEEIEPTGHDMYLFSTDDPTCTTGKIEHYRCHNCTAFDSTAKEVKYSVPEVEPLGHNYVENKKIRIPATAYADGHEYYICTRCGDLLEIDIPATTSGNTTHSFQNEDGEIIVSEGKVTKKATCTEEGEMTFICEGCKAELKLPIPATGHTYPVDPNEYTLITESAPDCTRTGQKVYERLCTVCGEADGANKVTIILPALGHDWSEWEDVGADIEYSCTTERQQTRYCKRCCTVSRDENGKLICDESGKPVEAGNKNYQTRSGGIKGHTFVDGVCTVCGFVENGHTINYMTEGVKAPDSLIEAAEKMYKPGTKATLWQPSSDKTLKDGLWTRLVPGGRAIFVGWSTVNLGADPIDKDAETVTEVTIDENSAPNVFAVWAMDRNKNGTPDYKETLVSIVYDINGGTGKTPDPLKYLLPGAAYPIETAPELTKGSDIFAGWSLKQEEKVIETNTEEADLAVIKALVASPYKVPNDTTGEIKLYAVYAKDEKDKDGNNNPDGKPDFCQSALHVEYYINGGEVNDGYTVVDDKDSRQDGMFYICNDYHSPGTNAELLLVEYGAAMIHRDNAVLIGWSAEPADDLITSMKKEKNYRDEIEDKYVTDAGEKFDLITKVSLTGAESNAKVYALWAKDENTNNIPDYEEKTLNHTYHRNQFLSQNNKTTLPEEYRLKIEKHEGREPDFVAGILPGMGVELAPNDYYGSADLVDGNGEPAGVHYVQVGWSRISHGVCDSQEKQDSWVIAGDANGYTGADNKYYRTILDERYQDAYAVWAIDNNINGKPDYEEVDIEKVKLTYDANGGTGTPPSAATCNKGAKVILAGGKGLTRKDTVFLGWSLTKNDIIKTQAEEDKAGIITQIASIDKDTTVYAVWAEDIRGGGDPSKDDPDPNKPVGPENPSNPSGIPDYKEVTLTYDTNGGTGDAPKTKAYKKGTTVMLASGSGLKLENAVFLGWSLTKHEGVIKTQTQEDAAGIITQIASIDKDTTVYAVWAEDIRGGSKEDPDPNKPVGPENPSNPSGIPDYKEVTLTYDLNGGTGSVPNPKTYRKGTTVTLNSGGTLRCTDRVFLGWSRAKHDIITTQEEEDNAGILDGTVTLTEDTTVYAVWAVDVKGGRGTNPDPTKPVKPGDPSDPSNPGNPSNPNNVADYKQATLTYDANGGKGTVPSPYTDYKGTSVTLDDGKGITLKDAVFIGWSSEKHEGIISSLEEENSVAKMPKAVTLENDITVYALWADDKNDNGIPDYNEGKTKVTLKYDANGGKGTVPPAETYYQGTRVTLSGSNGLTLENYVFIGWSLKKNGFINTQAEEEGAGIITQIESIQADTTVYAVWAIDVKGGPGKNPDPTKPVRPGGTTEGIPDPGNPANPNTVPDYKQATLTYDPNGGSGDVPRARTYYKGTKVTLAGGEGIVREKAVFLGWSLEKHEAIIESQAEEDSVKMITEIASIQADTTVYAVWAIDVKGGPGKDPDPTKPVGPENPSNPSDIADYKEVTLTYDANGGEGALPKPKTYEKGTTVDLDKGEGITRDKAVFIGWSLTKNGIIDTQAKETTAGIIDTVTLNKDTTVYAVWAIDVKGGPGKNPDPTKPVGPGDPSNPGDPGNPANPNDVPDYKQATLTYDANGGKGTVPPAETHYKGVAVTLKDGKGLTRDKAVFIGWSSEKHEGVITSQDEENSISKMPKTVTLDADITAYALWAADANGDGTPDYNEGKDQVTLTYNANGGKGAVPLAETYYQGTRVTLSGSNGLTLEDAVFIGWSLKKNGIIKTQAEEDAAGIIDTVTLNEDTTVYAVWAIDVKGGPGKNPDPTKPIDPENNPSNPSDIPDYRETDPDPGSGGSGDDPSGGSGGNPSGGSGGTNPGGGGGSTGSGGSGSTGGSTVPGSGGPYAPSQFPDTGNIPGSGDTNGAVPYVRITTPDGSEIPVTGDNRPVGVAVLLGLLALCMMGVFGILGFRKKDEDK